MTLPRMTRARCSKSFATAASTARPSSASIRSDGGEGEQEALCCRTERSRTEAARRADPKGKSPAKKQLKVRILLRADDSPLGPKWNDPKISEALGTYPIMCARVRQQLAQGGIDAVLNRKHRTTPPVPPIFDGEKEARLIALACSQPPEGRAKRTLRLLESKVVELNIVDHSTRHQNNCLSIHGRRSL
jgi:hypothetical protein